MRVRRLSTPSPRSAASESVWGFVFALLAGSRWAGAAVAVIVASMLMAGAPAALAGGATGALQTAGAPSPAPHVHRPPAAPDDLRAQQTPTPDDEIPDVALTLGGASHTVDVEGYFTDSVNGYEVRASPDNIVHTSRSGTEVTIKPIGAGSATVTVIGKKSGSDERKQFTVTVSAKVAAPTATGSIEAATVTQGAAHMVTASDYFEGEGVTYAAESSDTAVASVAVDGAAVTVTAVAAGSATVKVTATNASGSAEQSFAVTVAPPAPAAVGSIAAATLTEGATHMVTASDYFAGEGVTYAAESSDPAVAMVAVEGAVVTVTAVAAGSATVTVTATNAGGNAEQAFAITVLPPAPAAVGSIEAATLTEGATHMVTASDYFEGEGVTYTAGSSDTAVASVAVDGAAVTVTAVAVGSAAITVTATNAGGSAAQSFAVTVQLPPVTLTLGGAAQAIDLSEHFGDAVAGFDVSVSPAGVVQASMSGSLLTLTPLAVGAATVTLEVTAGEVSALHLFPATVAPAAPTTLGSIAALTLAGRETHTVTASDYFAGEGVTYDAESSDPGVATVAVDGAAVTVTAVAAGSATITVTATNEGGKAEQSFVITVQLPAVTLTLGGAAREIELADYFGDEVTGYEVTVSPSGIVHVSRSGSQLTLTAVAAGSATITVTATNAGGSAEQAFAVTVVPPAPAAVGSIEAVTLTEGATHMVTASDYFSGEGVTHTAESSDTEVTTVAVEGAVVTVTAVAVGSATITVAATNGGGSAEQSFAVTVVPLAPTAVASIEAATLTEGATHMVTASDYFEGEGAMYAAESSDPAVATVAVDGAVVTVTAVAAGRATITVTATSGGGSVEQSFAVTVLPPAPAAVGSIAAATLTEGATHMVTASDYFVGEGVTYTAESSDAEVATVAVEGATVTVTAVAAGSATITVTATNAGGSAAQSFAVTVQLPPVTLTLGGAAQAIELSEHFGDAVAGFDVSVSPAGVVQASMSGSLLTLTPLAVGTATVTLEVTVGEVSALHQFPATVAPAAPTALGSIATLTLAERETHTVTASDYFAGEGVTYLAESSDTEVATVAVDGAAVTVTAVAAGSATITVTATNEGGKAEQSFVVTVQLPAVTLTLGGAAREIELADYIGDEVTGYEVTVSPSGIVHVSRSGSQLTLTAVAAGSATITVTATNAGGSAEQAFAVTVLPPAPATVGSVAAVTINEGATHAVTASDYFGGEGVTYTAESSDPGVATVAVDGAAVTVTGGAAGSATITVTATNAGGSAEQRFAVTVVSPAPPAPSAPAAVGSIEAATLTEGAAHMVTASDYFSGGVAYAAESSDPAVATVAVEGAVVTLTGVAAGRATITVTATNEGGSAEQAFAVTVVPPAPTAVASIEAATLTEGATHTVTASDYFSGEGVTYTAGSSDPDGATVAVEGAVVTVTAVAAGRATITVTAANAGGSAEQTFAVTVVPSAPTTVGSVAAMTLTEGATHMVTASDYFVGEGITYTAESSDTGVATVVVDGSAVTVTAVAAGSATITVTATNAGGSAEQRFAVTVAPPAPPAPLAPAAVGSIAPATITEGATHMVTASDYFEGEAVTYAAESSDTGVATVAVDGAAVTLTAVTAGSATITVAATNAGGSAEQSLAVTVLLPAPTAAGSIEAATIAEGATHMVTASDYFVGEGITYTAESSDTGVATVAVEGAAVTVTAVAAGSATIGVTATNEGGSAEQAFAVTVLPRAPTAVGSIEAMTLAEGGAAQSVDLADHFSSAVVRYSVSAVPAGIVHVWESGGRLTLTPLAAGVATVTVTALSAGGSAAQALTVTVQARPPRALGAVPLTRLTEGDVLPLDAAAYFEGKGITYTARSSNAGVAAVEVYGASVLVRAAAVGGATVTVVAANGSGSAEQDFVVVVSPRGPRAAGRMADQTLIAGGAALETDLPGYFSGAFTRYGATAAPGGVLHLWESGGRLTLTPLAAGAATVTVWAANSSGSATQTFEVIVKQRAPKALAGSMPLSLTEGGAPHELDLADYFGGAVARYEVTAVPGVVVHFWQSGGRLTVTPLSTGIATVTVTATNDSGSSVQGFDLAVAPAAPRMLGGIPDVALHEGGATREIALADYFDGASVSYEATATPDGIVHLWESGGRLRLTPLAAGVATVEATAANVSGSISQLFAVTVESEAPRALGRIEGVTLTVGGDAWGVALADHFAGVVERYVAAAEPGGVVHLWESGGRLRLTPLAAGIATVTATAINTAGSAEQAFAIVVAPAAPRALGGIADVTLAEGGEAPEVDLSDYFGGTVDRYVVTADAVGVVHVWESGGRLTLTPLASGSASVMVTALNGSGSAAQEFAVIVEPPAAVGP